MPERACVRIAGGRAQKDRTVANRVQPGAATFESRLPDAAGVRHPPPHPNKEHGRRAHRCASQTTAGRRGAERAVRGSKTRYFFARPLSVEGGTKKWVKREETDRRKKRNRNRPALTYEWNT